MGLRSISRDKTVIGITEKAGQDLGHQNSNHCYPKTDMARKDQRQAVQMT